MACATALKTAWNLAPILARSRFHPCQYAKDVRGLRCSTQASRTRGSGNTWTHMDARDRGQLVVERAGEREQLVALILQRHAYRADASRIIRAAPLHLGGDKVELVLSNLQARTGQRQNVVAQPCGERPDVTGKCMRACLGMAGKCEPVGNVRPPGVLSRSWPAASCAAIWRPWRCWPGCWPTLRPGA